MDGLLDGNNWVDQPAWFRLNGIIGHHLDQVCNGDLEDVSEEEMERLDQAIEDLRTFIDGVRQQWQEIQDIKVQEKLV